MSTLNPSLNSTCRHRITLKPPCVNAFSDLGRFFLFCLPTRDSRKTDTIFRVLALKYVGDNTQFGPQLNLKMHLFPISLNFEHRWVRLWPNSSSVEKTLHAYSPFSTSTNSYLISDFTSLSLLHVFSYTVNQLTRTNNSTSGRAMILPIWLFHRNRRPQNI